MNKPIATIRRQCPNTGKWITGPAHLFAPQRITDSDVREHGSFNAAKAVMWGRA